jgi:hypothetical protein
MSERELCQQCGGNGTLNIRHGVTVCPRCKGDCWEPKTCPNCEAAERKLAAAERREAEKDQRIAELVEQMARVVASLRHTLASPSTPSPAPMPGESVSDNMAWWPPRPGQTATVSGQPSPPPRSAPREAGEKA